MNTEFTICIKPPSECSETELEQFRYLVESAGKVVEHLSERIRKRGHQLVFAYSGDILAGTAAIKVPYDSYKTKAFEDSKCALAIDDFTYELGWIVVHKDFREQGLAHCLIKQALKTIENKNVLATTRKNNEAIHKCLCREGFQQCGSSYVRRGNNIILFTRHSNTM